MEQKLYLVVTPLLRGRLYVAERRNLEVPVRNETNIWNPLPCTREDMPGSKGLLGIRGEFKEGGRGTKNTE